MKTMPAIRNSSAILALALGLAYAAPAAAQEAADASISSDDLGEIIVTA